MLGRHLFEAFPDNPGDPQASGVRNLGDSLQRVLRHRLANAMPLQRYDIRDAEGGFVEKVWDPVNTPIVTDGDRLDSILHHVVDATARSQWRAPYTPMRDARAHRLEDVAGVLTAMDANVRDTDRLLKDSFNLISASEVIFEQSQQLIRESRERLGAAPSLAADKASGRNHID